MLLTIYYAILHLHINQQTYYVFIGHQKYDYLAAQMTYLSVVRFSESTWLNKIYIEVSKNDST